MAKRGKCVKCKRDDMSILGGGMCGKCYFDERKKEGKPRERKPKDRLPKLKTDKSIIEKNDAPSLKKLFVDALDTIEKHQGLIKAMDKEIAVLLDKIAELRKQKLDMRIYVLRTAHQIRQLSSQKLQLANAAIGEKVIAKEIELKQLEDEADKALDEGDLQS